MSDANQEYKKMAFTLALFFVTQTGALLYFLGQQETRIDNLEQQLSVSIRNNDRLTRVEVLLENIAAGVRKLERKIE